jgi:hypothetical protein
MVVRMGANVTVYRQFKAPTLVQAKYIAKRYMLASHLPVPVCR